MWLNLDITEKLLTGIINCKQTKYISDIFKVTCNLANFLNMSLDNYHDYDYRMNKLILSELNVAQQKKKRCKFANDRRIIFFSAHLKKDSII